jgi:hypothetical protein
MWLVRSLLHQKHSDSQQKVAASEEPMGAHCKLNYDFVDWIGLDLGINFGGSPTPIRRCGGISSAFRDACGVLWVSRLHQKDSYKRVSHPQ